MSEEDKKLGAPSKYDKKYESEMIAMAKKGKTSSEWASKWGVTKTTVHEWRKAHESFSYAYDRAIEESRAWVAKQARSFITTEGATSAQVSSLKFFAGATLKMRENDTTEEIEEAVAKKLPKFVNAD